MAGRLHTSDFRARQLKLRGWAMNPTRTPQAPEMAPELLQPPELTTLHPAPPHTHRENESTKGRSHNCAAWCRPGKGRLHGTLTA